MNYYKRHVGDYAKKAGHLSIVEHGIYTLLLDAYYDREQGPTRAEAVRWSRARTDDEMAALDAVLADFFTFDGERYVQSRVEEEFAKASAQATANAANGKRGGRPRKQPKTDSVSSGKRNDCEKNPNPLIHQSTNPNGGIAPAGAPADPCPHEEILALYHDFLPDNPKIKAWTGKRRDNLRARWREDAKRQDIAYWVNFFKVVGDSDFLTGRTQSRDGRPPFCPGLDWMVLPENFAKIIEGRYVNKEAA